MTGDFGSPLCYASVMMQIEGIPEGWELARIGSVKPGEYRLMQNGDVSIWDNSEPSHGWVVVLRKVEKLKQYRPFANAEEFKPHRDRWWRYKNDDEALSRPPEKYWDCGSGMHSWKESFEIRIFDDGTPFGVEVA